MFLLWEDELFALRAQKYSQGIGKYKNTSGGERV